MRPLNVHGLQLGFGVAYDDYGTKEVRAEDFPPNSRERQEFVAWQHASHARALETRERNN